MSESYTVTVFECYEYTSEMLEWLKGCDSMLVSIKNESQEIREVSMYGNMITFPGKTKPLVVTIADDAIALMFRLKYPNVHPKGTMIYSTAHGLNPDN